MKKTKLEMWRVRWTGMGHKTIVSAVGYSKEGAEDRAEVLRAKGWENVEVYQSKVDSEDPI